MGTEEPGDLDMLTAPANRALKAAQRALNCWIVVHLRRCRLPR
jgi:hypothetical protein